MPASKTSSASPSRVEQGAATADFRPLYRQVKDMLRRAALVGRHLDARRRRSPSEFELAADIGVSQGTVRKALDELANREPAGALSGPRHLRRQP